MSRHRPRCSTISQRARRRPTGRSRCGCGIEADGALRLTSGATSRRLLRKLDDDRGDDPLVLGAAAPPRITTEFEIVADVRAINAASSNPFGRLDAVGPVVTVLAETEHARCAVDQLSTRGVRPISSGSSPTSMRRSAEALRRGRSRPGRLRGRGRSRRSAAGARADARFVALDRQSALMPIGPAGARRSHFSF